MFGCPHKIVKQQLHVLSLNPTYALHGGVSYFAFVCLLAKYLKKILNRSTSFLVEVFPLTQGQNRSILKKNHCKKLPRGKGRCGSVEIWS